MFNQNPSLPPAVDSQNQYVKWLFALPALAAIAYAGAQSYMSITGILFSLGFVFISRIDLEFVQWKLLRTVFVVLMGWLLLINAIPGMTFFYISKDTALGELSAPETVGVGISVAIIICTLLPNIIARDKPGWRVTLNKESGMVITQKLNPAYMANWTLQLAIGTAFFALLAGFAMNVIAVEPKLPERFEWWQGVMLIKIVAFECLFRGELQKTLKSQLGAFSVFIAAVVGATVFGSGVSLEYFGFLCIIGLGCGMAYHITDNLMAPIFVAFIVTSVQFFFFTYPYTLVG